MAYLLFIGLCAMWGSNFILMKKATLWFDPITVGHLRVLGGAVFLGGVQLIRQGAWPIRRRDLWSLTFVAALGYAFPFALQPVLIERCGSGFIGIMVSLVPLMTIIASVPMLGIFPTTRQLVGVLGGLGFLMLILKDGINREIGLSDFLLAATVPLVYSICNTYIKRRFTGLAPLPLALSCLMIASLLLGPYAVIFPRNPNADPNSLPLALVAISLLGVVGTGFGAYAFTKLLQERGPLFAGMVTYLIPSIALLWGWIDGEPVTGLQIAGLTGVLAMVAVVQYNPGKSTEHVLKKTESAESTTDSVLVPIEDQA